MRAASLQAKARRRALRWPRGRTSVFWCVALSVLLPGLLAPGSSRGATIIEQNIPITAHTLTARDHQIIEDCVAEIGAAKRDLWINATEKEFGEFARSEQLPEETQKKLHVQLAAVILTCVEAWNAKLRPVLESYCQRQRGDFWNFAIFWIGRADKVASYSLPEEFTRPLDAPAWKKALSEHLPPELVAQWEVFHEAGRQKKRKAIAAILQPCLETKSALATRNLAPVVNETKYGLGLAMDRCLQVDRAARAAAQTYVGRWAEMMTALLLREEGGPGLEEATNWSETDAFDKLSPPRVNFREALLKLLTTDEIQKLAKFQSERAGRRAEVRGRQRIAALDLQLALTEKQCKALEPLAAEAVAAELDQVEDLPPGDGVPLHEYLGGSLWRLSRDVLRPVLDAAQLLRRDRPLRRFGVIRLSDEYQANSNSENPDDVDGWEATLSNLAERCAQQWRTEIASLYLLQVEDIARTSHPPDETARRLSGAAQRQIEEKMNEWRTAFVQRLRDEIGNSESFLPEGKLTSKICCEIAETILRTSDPSAPEKDAAWKETIHHLLSPDEWNRWCARLEERARYTEAARPQMALAEFDSLLFLESNQLERLRPLIQNFVTEYGPDLTAQFSGTGGFGWNVLSPSVFLPFASAETEVKAILTPEQWECWASNEHYSGALDAWKELRKAHEQRAQPAKF